MSGDLKIEELSVKRANAQVLQDVSLFAERGKVTVLLGANGAGKSTLLKAISGQSMNTNGQILINQKNLKDWKPKALAHQRAVLSQHIQLSFSFSVIDTILLGRFGRRLVEFFYSCPKLC